ncbi:MAG: alkyl hydroperoxide reductase/Thiol specific antioxidant/Mal allergen [Gemmatimonadetes bacterium]|nr:alkyl hydroperoxide reductase/Thiol specific antioxidant/Mal allergen [Gemmatimonadota bacterium]
MLVLVLAFLGGVLTILSPCILPIIPLVFARTGRSFAREIAPMLGGLAIAFTAAALIATTTAHWLIVANVVGRDVALLLFAIVGITLVSTRAAEWIARPATRAAAALLGSHTETASARPLRNVVVGMAIGLLWAPCAGPILGVLIAAAATTTAPRAALLFFTFALGAAMSLAAVLSLGSRLIARIKRAGATEFAVRRILGVATLVTVVAIFFGFDQLLFGKGGLVKTASAEDHLVATLSPERVQPHPPGMSLDEFAAEEDALAASIHLDKLNGDLPGFDGGTEWINSGALSPKALEGKVVLVDFWTFMCYNCLNALPHVKELYAKYKDRGFVVVGVHTPELGPERVPQNVRDAVKRLGITFPVVIDNDNRIWNAFHNQYWPAAYFADATGKLRFYNFGEGRYDEQDKVVAKLLAERDAAEKKRPSTSMGDRGEVMRSAPLMASTHSVTPPH